MRRVSSLSKHRLSLDITWLKYCRYGVKFYPYNQSIIVFSVFFRVLYTWMHARFLAYLLHQSSDIRYQHLVTMFDPEIFLVSPRRSILLSYIITLNEEINKLLTVEANFYVLFIYLCSFPLLLVSGHFKRTETLT